MRKKKKAFSLTTALVQGGPGERYHGFQGLVVAIIQIGKLENLVANSSAAIMGPLSFVYAIFWISQAAGRAIEGLVPRVRWPSAVPIGKCVWGEVEKGGYSFLTCLCKDQTCSSWNKVSGSGSAVSCTSYVRTLVTNSKQGESAHVCGTQQTGTVLTGNVAVKISSGEDSLPAARVAKSRFRRVKDAGIGSIRRMECSRFATKGIFCSEPCIHSVDPFFPAATYMYIRAQLLHVNAHAACHHRHILHTHTCTRTSTYPKTCGLYLCALL